METHEIVEIIDDAILPDEMSKERAVSFLKEIISDLQDKVEALEMEIEDED